MRIFVPPYLFDFLQLLQAEFFEPGLQILEPGKILDCGTCVMKEYKGHAFLSKNSGKNHTKLKK